MKENIKIRNDNNFAIPLLIQTYKSKGTKLISLLNINDTFLEQLLQDINKENASFLHLDRSLPMIYFPAQWQDYEFGGYYLRPTNLIRLTDCNDESIKYADLTKTFSILDLISSVPWKINKKILQIVNQFWENGGNIGTVPPRNEDRGELVHEYMVKDCQTIEEKYKLLKQIQNQRDRHSLRCDFSLKLGVAEAFSGIERIYFPHNMDFRGRLYPIPPHLNHMGADLARGLLEFSEGLPLGESGLKWLRIHLGNLMGKDKLPMQEREEYVLANWNIIEKCVNDPFKNRVWAEQEDCWQCLAAMIDYVAAMRSPDPLKYISCLHIHQDGSCNGLQHYAALGRDIEGATQVNLAQTSRPGDVYTHVAKMVEAKLEKDMNDPKSKFHELAKKLSGQIKRKVVKQTVMTSVYGVTFIGAREQIHRQIKGYQSKKIQLLDRGILAEDDSQQYQASIYLASTTLEAIKDLFEGAHKIKQWLIECATIISNLDQPVSWITPLGLPVVQPYRTQNHLDQVNTVMQSITIQSESQKLPIQKTKQRSAFPPNFIHSLDSTHLMYTSIECKKVGITFAAVHDSYWTHAAKVDELNQILREQFVRLHSQPLLEDLYESFKKRYPEVQFPPVPERGEFDLENVKKSRYFFA